MEGVDCALAANCPYPVTTPKAYVYTNVANNFPVWQRKTVKVFFGNHDMSLLSKMTDKLSPTAHHKQRMRKEA